MALDWQILQVVSLCKYKAWLLNKLNGEGQELSPGNPGPVHSGEVPGFVYIHLEITKLNLQEKVRATLLSQLYAELHKLPIEHVQINYVDGNRAITYKPFPVSKYSNQSEVLRKNITGIVSTDDPPAFYKNPHCKECQFKDGCQKKLQEKDCISLLGGMTEKIIAKYHKKGIFSITQLSHIFRPRRRGRRPQSPTSYLWELKALALREQKVFVIHQPEIEQSEVSIYIDFEGLPEEGMQYLIGALVVEKDKPAEHFSFWANGKENEMDIFRRLFDLLQVHPEAPIYHYGSYETKVLNHVRKWGTEFKQKVARMESRMVNLLSYLRTHVYPPTYSNGLKDVSGYLGFEWTDKHADGLQSIVWRRNWETTKDVALQEKLQRYNQEDCMALQKVHTWFMHLDNEADGNVLKVAEMKRKSPYKFQKNTGFSEDFQHINKAAYFDYQRSRIYFRDKRNSPPAALKNHQVLKPGKGIRAWKPSKVNEVIMTLPLTKCPKCGHTKLYQLKTATSSVIQTDLKFTPTGIKQWVMEHRSFQAKCAKCMQKFSNRVVKRLQYGDNLLAWAVNLYVRYHLSHEMIAKALKEQFGIWINPMYLVQRKHKWLAQFTPEVDYLWQTILKSPVIHIDETNIRLSNDKGYVWAFATPYTVFYHFTFTRDADFLQEWLKDYKGVIVTDSFPGYETLKIKQQKCLIHMIRDLNDDLFKNPFDEEYKAIVTAFGQLLKKVIDTIDRFGLSKKHMQKHVNEIDFFYQQIQSRTYKSELAAKYTKRLKKHWEQLWTFIHHDGVPWNNNNAEAAVKAFAQHRRGVNGQMGEKGLREYLKMLSLAQTCRYRNLSFLHFLRRKVGLWQNIAPELLPGFLPFRQARQYMHRLGFERKKEWVAWLKSGKCPDFIPHCPNTVYKKDGWISWHDWVGFAFLPFEEARTYMRRLQLRNREEYWAWLQSGKRPKTIPSCPEKIYKHIGWIDLGDWLGTENTGHRLTEEKKAWL